jgi:hypothetical protein
MNIITSFRNQVVVRDLESTWTASFVESDLGVVLSLVACVNSGDIRDRRCYKGVGSPNRYCRGIWPCCSSEDVMRIRRLNPRPSSACPCST